MNDRPEGLLDVLVVGGGQAGLAMAWHLRRPGTRFLVLEAGPEVGHVWRARWDSLKLFTPAQFSSLPGMPFPAPTDTYPAKEPVANYLHAYAKAFHLPVQLNARVTDLRRAGDIFEVRAGDAVHRARQVVVATGPFQVPFTPPVARKLDRSVTQMHSAARGEFVIGADRRRLQRAGVRFRPRSVDAEGNLVRFADGGTLAARTVIWATGFRSDYSWMQIPGLADGGPIAHRRGVTEIPGLYFLGLPWQHTRGSALLGFVHDDAAYLADRIAADRQAVTSPTVATGP